ncbi:MAG: hypothetical protein HN597_03560 [Desulfobacula sp.]|jgi:hypothetical protein|uniref:Uncharacterized protein n=1 Tax=uncultured marine virus TaxID=186617 RepID=A0A0F7L1T0_9VIRU|nr:hypothetical protein [uncultured marine virus]MBT7628767.1 hypothetical protein [Desulfobacula sp.]
MTKGLTGIQVTVLTWLVYALIMFLTVVTGWQQIKFTELPNEFVRLERYQSDENKSTESLCRIERKLDELIMSRVLAGKTNDTR